MDFNSTTHNILEKVTQYPCYIMGDFNLDPLKHDKHLPTEKFLDVMYTTAQKFPFKISKQASTMNPDIISKSRTYTNSVTMPVYWVFYC